MEAQKILYIINHMDWFWSHRLPLAQGAQQEGRDVCVAASGAGSDRKLAEHGFTGADLPAADKGFAPLAALNIIQAVHRVIRSENPALLHAVTLKYAFLAGLAARAHKNLRVVHTVAGLGYLFSGNGLKPKMLRLLAGPFLKIALNHPHAQIIFQNPDDRDLMVRRRFVRPERTHLIRGSGVDTNAFRFSAEPGDDMPLVVMPTRLVHDKGVSVFIEAAGLLKQRGVRARFLVAGGETRHNPRAITKAEMESMIADGAAEWPGKVDDMPALLRACTLVVYPSWYREGIPKVLLEACASGRAIVTTDHPGCREAVKHGENGLLVPVRDAEKTADAVQYLLEHKEERRSMAEAARRRAETEFDVRMIVRETLAVYRKALQGR